MEILKILCASIQIISAILVIILVLMQHGKGADAGATFGSSGSASLFGSNGATNFLSRITAIFATTFFIATFLLVLLLNHNSTNLGVMTNLDKSLATPTALSSQTATKNQIPE